MQESVEVDGVQRPIANSLGKPIAATEEGILAFWRWFGDSKMVDDQGRPLVLFHGSANATIEKFDINLAGSIQKSDWGAGLYLTPSRGQADYYRSEALKHGDKEEEELWAQLEAMDRKTKWKNGSPIRPEGYDAIFDKWRTRRGKLGQGSGGRIYALYAKILTPYITSGTMSWSDSTVAKTAQQSGKDGVVVMHGGGGIDEVLVFQPSQVKSAEGNDRFSNSESINENAVSRTMVQVIVDRRLAMALSSIPRSFDGHDDGKHFDHHVTLFYNPNTVQREAISDLDGKTITIKITGLYRSDSIGAEAFTVEMSRNGNKIVGANKHQHITHSLRDGVRAVASNSIFTAPDVEDVPLDRAIVGHGTLTIIEE